MSKSEDSLFQYAVFSEAQAFDKLQSSPNGLSVSEASKRLLTNGRNELQGVQQRGLFVEFLGHFKSPLVITLLFASAVSFALGDNANAIIITCIVVISAVLDFFEEKGAHDAAKKLKESVKNKVQVARDGNTREVDSEEICEGDIVLLNAGKIVPADGRVLEAKDFFVNQSALTGESFPNEKTASVLKKLPASLDELNNMVLMGTNVVSGSAKVLIVKTGMQTQFGKITSKLTLPDQETSFSHGVHQFGYLVMRVTVILVVFIFVINGVYKQNWLEAFMFALAVAVGLTPELLTMIMSVSMARGSQQMAKKGAIVKRLTSIPNFGSMDVLCTDKTGTLTQDKITLVKCTDADGQENEQVHAHAYLNSYFQSGIKNPLDDAMLINKKIDVSAYQKIDEVPFDFFRKKMSVVVKRGNHVILITKGAPEEVLKSCKITESAQRDRLNSLYESFSRDGYKVLAIAIKEVSPQPHPYSKEDERDLEFCGFVSFLDPPKEEAKETIQSLMNLVIEIKIITGDNHLVAQKIASSIKLTIKGIMQGEEMDHLTDDALIVRTASTTIFARFSPDQKNRVLHAIKAHHIVGYLGDGINDAPSLKMADVGISVNNATDVAKESADIILTRKSLLILKDGVLEGRKTFANTVKYIQMGLSSNFGNMFSMAAAAVFLPFLPMLPVQILLNNFIYDFSQVTIPSDKVDNAFINVPKKWDLNFLKNFMVTFGIISSVFDLITFYLFYHVFKTTEAQFQTAWFLESLTTQTLVIHVIRTQKVPFVQSMASRAVLISTIACVLLGWLMVYTPLHHYFNFAPLPWEMVLPILSLVVIYLILVEFAKRIFYKKNGGDSLRNAHPIFIRKSLRL
ncbi:MAG: magnesium-translocating P-type ATPase [Cyclobacteriaceae bacterium]|nr:magnesium-translocating P-type ATPase [Cyclobacteriaceae bacterium]